MTRRTVNLMRFWLTLALFSLPALSFTAASIIRFHTGLFRHADVDMRSYLMFGVVVTIFWAFVVEKLGFNRIANLLTLRTGIATAAKACGYCMLFSLSFVFFYRTITFARIFVVLGCTLLFVLSVALIHVFRGIVHAMDNSPNGRFPIAILGADEYAVRVGRGLCGAHGSRCRVACYVALPGQTPSADEAPILEWDRLEDCVDLFHCSEILICLPPERLGQSQEFLEASQHLCIPARMVLNFGDGIFVPERLFEYHGIPLLDVRPYPVDDVAYWIGKRVFDIIFSTCVLVIGLPLLIVIALAIRLTSKGGVFFTQERISLNGRRFKMIKFRSMYDQDARTSNERHTSRFDARITPVGRFLRRTSLDELPQFLNVLKGDMSVVGPRPELTHFVQKFRYEIPRYMARHNVKSGITGWAQVNGLRGSHTSIARRIEFDLYYMRNWSMLFDIRIILMTIAKGLLGAEAY